MAKKRHSRSKKRKNTATLTLTPTSSSAPARERGKAKPIILALTIVLALAACVWLIVSPALEKQKALAHQRELLSSIEQGDGAIVLQKGFVPDVDYYDEPDVLPGPVSAVSEETEPAQEGVATIEATPTSLAEDTTIDGIGVLFIEKIDLKLPITDGITKTKLKVTPGHVPQSAAIGEVGNAVIAGHRSYTYGEHFNRLGELANGDVLLYQPIGGEVMRFEVFEVLTVLPDDQSVFEQPSDQTLLSLYTCTPVRQATHRLVIRAKLI